VHCLPFAIVSQHLRNEPQQCELVALTLPPAPVTTSAVIAAAHDAARLLALDAIH